MRSGGVVGLVQEKATWYRKPVPIRYPQPLSQGLRPCQLPFSIAGVSAETPGGTAAGAARDLPRAARTAQCRREPVFPATEAV